jgi:membrane-bound lytic murein transglycosylase A
MKMVSDGVLGKEQVSADALRRYFAGHPQDMNTYLWHNPRTVFFAERPGGPFGSLNVPVTPRATIATDKKVYPPGLPAMVVLRQPLSPPAARRVKFTRGGWEPAHLLVLDQDTGGAIRAAGRCDVYLGVGGEAEREAGDLLAEGELYYLVAK